MRLKVRLACALTILVHHKIESEAVFTVVDSVPYFKLLSLVSLNLDTDID